jgi:MoxR-like ATPase
MKYIEIQAGREVRLTAPRGLPELVHVFDQDSIQAVNAALAARRPLLVRGEPGIGKSQLARAAAKALQRVYVPFVVDARTESRDLLWHFDAVARLAEAQLCGALRSHTDSQELQRRLNDQNFIRPGPLWWVFDWDDARKQAGRVGAAVPPQPDGGQPENGAVVLIDEIDKAESDVPNGLLEALGAGRFTPQGRAESVTISEIMPLVLITTNEERALPDAFVRRCLVLYLALPTDGDTLIQLLVGRGAAHFPAADREVLQVAAQLLVQDREAAQREHVSPLPGQAEYLDLVRAVLGLDADPQRQKQILHEVRKFVLKKQQGTQL